MAQPPGIPPSAPGARFARDANGNPIYLVGPASAPLAQAAFGPAVLPWNPTVLFKTRAVSLLGSDTSLCDANGAFRFAGHQADGVSFTTAFYETAGSSLNNPGGYARTSVASGGTGGGGAASIATLSASFATNIMTVASTSVPLLPFSVISGVAGVTAGTFVLPYGTGGATGTGGAGTYQLSTSPGTIALGAATATYKFIERVADTANTSAQTSAGMQNAWKLRCGGAHYNVSNHARNQITTPTLAPYSHYTCKFEFRWDSTNISAIGQASETSVPPFDTMYACLLWQLHQFNSSQPPETNQLSLGVPAFTLTWESGKLVFRISRCDENMGSIQLNGAGNPYLAFDQGDNMTSLNWSWSVPLNSYVKITFDFFLDDKGIQQGGRGYFKVYAGNQLIVDYYGPTLQPLRAIDHVPQIVDPQISFGMYFFNTPYDTVTTNTVTQSLIASTANYNPFRDCALLIRQFFLLGN